MLTEICAELKNYFLRNRECDIHSGTFTIENGSIDLSFLQDGQYFRIVGSVFNDGVWQYPLSDLKDEVFVGSIWAMAMPPEFIALADEITEWVNTNSAVLDSPYQSESFAGYSYSLKSGNANTGDSGAFSWKSQFASRLAKWRKI